MPVEAITLDYTNLTVKVGGTRVLSATVLPKDSADTVLWTSSDITKATVVNGVVTGISKGNATITATCGGKTDSCIIIITPIFTLVSVAEAKLRLSIDFDSRDNEIQSRIDSIVSYLAYATGIKPNEWGNLDTETQNIAKEYILSTLFYDYYEEHNELNDKRLTRMIKQLQVIGGLI